MAAAAMKTTGRTRKALVRDAYGSPEVLRLEEVERPALTDDGVLVRVRAVSLNRADWYTLIGIYVGRPQTGLRKPKGRFVGSDFAGTIEAVGGDVSGFQPGDEVFGGKAGALTDYLCARAEAVALKPAHLSFEEAAAVPVAGLTALQGLRDHGHLEAGQKVLINGASGGVGTFAIQIAKALGADVTAVCSSRNVERARSLGANRVIDYTKEDFTKAGERYDLMFDNAGNRSWRACKRVLKPRATVVLVGGQMGSKFLGPMPHVIGSKLASLLGSRKAVFFVAKFNKTDMETLRELLESKKIVPAIDRRYDFDQFEEAFRYLGDGHAQGKVVLTVSS